jgi:hypothetical protein
MIKFFRNIRKNLLNKGLPAGQAGKTTKYFKYAIGEIILVVIGILIALQINNWNEVQKQNRWETRFLTDLKNELKNDLSQLKRITDIQLAKGDNCQKVLDLISTKNPDNKSKIDSLYSLTQNSNPTFFPTTGVYDSGLSSGKIENIKNDSIKYMIMNLYNHYYKRLVYNGEILDSTVEKVDWERQRYFDKPNNKLRSWELVMEFEFQAQTTFLLDQNIVYTGLAKQNILQIEHIIQSISNELNK